MIWQFSEISSPLCHVGHIFCLLPNVLSSHQLKCITNYDSKGCLSGLNHLTVSDLCPLFMPLSEKFKDEKFTIIYRPCMNQLPAGNTLATTKSVRERIYTQSTDLVL